MNENNLDNSNEFGLHIIIEKFIFQLQHRIYKAERQKNEKNLLSLQRLFTKSWCIHVFVKWMKYKLTIKSNYYKKNSYWKTKKILIFLLPEYYLTFLMLQPQWEARFEKHSFDSRVGFKTYTALSIINRKLNKKKQYILKMELNSENKLKLIIPIKKRILYKKPSINSNFQQIKTPLNEYKFYLLDINTNTKYTYIKNCYLKYFHENISKEFLHVHYLNPVLNINMDQRDLNIYFNFNFGNFNTIQFLALNNLNSQLEIRNSDEFIYREGCLFVKNQLNFTFLMLSFCYCKEFFLQSYLYQNLVINKQSISIKLKEKKFLLPNNKKAEMISAVFNFKAYEIKFSLSVTQNLFWQIFPCLDSLEKNNNFDLLINQNCLFFSFNKKTLINSLPKVFVNSFFTKDGIKGKKSSNFKGLNTSQNIVIVKKFFKYWLTNLKKFGFSLKNPNFFKQSESIHSNMIILPSKCMVRIKNQSTIFFFNKKIKQQFHFLYWNSSKLNYKKLRLEKNDFFENQRILYLDLNPLFQTNFSIISKNTFTSQVKKQILARKSKIVINIFLQQNKLINTKVLFDSFIKNNSHLCDKIELLLGQKFNSLKKFMPLSNYKLVIRKFMTSNDNSFYFNHFKLRHLCGFFTNILFHGIESDFYNWFNIKYKNNFKNLGCFLRYGNQIVLLYPNLECLNDSESFFKQWFKSQNLNLNFKIKKITTSLINSIDKDFLNKNLTLIPFSKRLKTFYQQNKRQNLFKKFSHFYKKKMVKQFSKNFDLDNLFNFTEFIIETRKSIFLEKNNLSIWEKYNINSSFKYSKNKNKDTLQIAHFVPIDSSNTTDFSFLFQRQFLKTKATSKKHICGLNFLGFYIYQFTFYPKIDLRQSNKFLFETQIFPSKFSIKYHLELLKKIITKNSTETQKVLIQKLSPYISTWADYYKIVSTKQLHAYCDYVVFKMLWNWACKRHSNKSKKWIKLRYFHCLNGKNWVFGVYQKYNNSFYCLPNHMDVKLCKIEDFENVLSPFSCEIFFWHS